MDNYANETIIPLSKLNCSVTKEQFKLDKKEIIILLFGSLFSLYVHKTFHCELYNCDT